MASDATTNGGNGHVELSIKTDYMPAWGLWEGVRELVQNAKDGESQLKAKMTVAHDPAAETLTITNDGVVLPHEALLLGHTTKVGATGLIGQFGEGLKIGILALVRAGHAVTIRNGAETWTPSIGQSRNFDAKVLAVDIVPAGRGPRALAVTVAGISAAQWEEFRERFLFLARPTKDESARADVGALLTGARFRGRLYVKGIFVQVDPDLRYGYDFNDAQVDRDRKMVEAYDRGKQQAWIWRGALRQLPGLVPTFHQLLASEAKDVAGISEYNASDYVSETVRNKLAAAFRSEHGRKAVPVASEAEVTDLEHLGRRGVVVPRGLRAVIGSVVGTLESVRADLSNEVKRTIPWAQLSPAQRANLSRGLDMVRLTGETIALTEVSVVEFRDDCIDGMYHGADGRISVAARAAADPRECLLVLIHEVAHRRGRDGDKGHVAAIESMWARLAVKLLERVETAEAAAATATADTEDAEDRAERAQQRVVRAPAARSEWGRAGTAAEAFRRLIMTNGADGQPALSDKQIFERVLAELGPDRAGHPEHVGWYRCQLRKQGKDAPAAVGK